jgi:leucyl/phenylalanyl-tRNA--protein transferase
MRQILQQLHVDDLAFPPLQAALSTPNGLLAVGGDLSPQRLVHAYSQGIFPWYGEDEPIMWWSPDPRAILPVKNIKINRTLTKVLKRKDFKLSVNRAFEQVLAHCADAPFRNEETWIVPQMICAYTKLHKLGYAHSIEVWLDNELVGGLYGIAINGYFSGESMFYKHSNASKVALVGLAKLLDSINVSFFDCQILNPFLQDMGAVEVSRKEFINLKQIATEKILPAGFWQPAFLFD